MKGLRCKSAKGHTYWYLEIPGDRIPVPCPDDPDFDAAVLAAEKGHRLLERGPQTFRRLITAYRKSDSWQHLSPRSMTDYDRVLIWITANLGHRRPAEMKRMHVIAAMVANDHRIRFANYVRQILIILFERAITLGWLETNPARGVPQLRRRGPPMHRPWPHSMIESFAAAAGPVPRTIMELSIGTGQRIGDVLRMRWTDIAGDVIRMTQQKTGRALTLPITDRLGRHLATTPRTGLTIVAGRHGQPLTYKAAWKRVMKVRQAADATSYTIHGWRYTTADELATVGCTDAEIQSILGHTTIVNMALYAGAARQISNARSALQKRENTR